MKKILFGVVIAISVMVYSIAGMCADPNKPTLTVYGFDVKASSGILHDASWDIGTGMGEMLVNALLETGKFNVVERLNIEDITFEQDLVTKGRVSKKTGAKTGKMIGAQYIVRGAITEFDVREAGGTGDINIKGFSFGLSSSNAHVAGIIRIYDATTGEIISSERFEKKVPATGVKFGYHKGSIGGNLGGFKKTPLGKATQLAITDMVRFVISRASFSIPSWVCPKCNMQISEGHSFCPTCGESRPAEQLTQCPGCGADIAPGAKFCGECGAKLTKSQCPQCHATVEPGTKFCQNCGTKIEK